MIRINKNVIMTPELIGKIVNRFNTEDISRLIKLENYYKGKQDILNRQLADPTKPNNKSVNPFANYITDMFVGYFMGEPVSYTGDGAEEINMIFRYNDEADENSELAKDASVYGIAYEMCYVDSEGNVRFKRIDPKEVIIIYDNTIEEEMLYAIRSYGEYNPITDRIDNYIEVYDKEYTRRYTADDVFNSITLVDEEQHYFGLVPFSCYKNNDDKLGDFELVTNLIDDYDRLQSDSLNEFEYFVDSYLVMKGMIADSDDVKAMKENRVLLLDQDASAEWLTKNANDTNVENLKTRIVEDIHKFSKCPALTDKDFAGNASGVAMKYKLMGMEDVSAIKERKFKKGLQRRLELITRIVALKTSTIDWRDIEISFKRNIPVNTTEIADMISKLNGIVSNETLISQLPFIEDAVLEAEKVKNEKELNTVNFFQGGFVNEGLGENSGTDVQPTNQ